jgi:aryl-alcohol dehydrogenase-like predicted oxidoreductase
MQTSRLGPFGGVSRLTLGGGGIGQLWGETTVEEALATVRAALEAGINLIDTAPIYLGCEDVVASAFHGALPEGVRITSKCQLGAPAKGNALAQLDSSLDVSLEAMRLERVDAFFLHSNICEDDTVYAHGHDRRDSFATPWSQYVDEVAPALESLKSSGRIGAWGITGVGVPSAILKALAHELRPDLVQIVTNLLDSPGAMRRYAEAPRPRELIAAAVSHGVSVMGIRAVQAGALTSGIDRTLSDTHPEVADFHRARPYRALCQELGEDPALLAHRYALGMDGVDTVVLGVKNRDELAQCVRAESLGPLPQDVRARIDGLGLALAG